MEKALNQIKSNEPQELKDSVIENEVHVSTEDDSSEVQGDSAEVSNNDLDSVEQNVVSKD